MEAESNRSGSLKDGLVIVLQISEAIGLNAAELIWSQASLSGNKLDREPIKTGHTTNFDCSLIWETDRKSIKQMKTENVPVKIEFYSIKNYRGDINTATKEHIGYILLPVRGIPMIPVQKAFKAKCRWMKIIGLSKEFRTHKPEVLINIMITENEFMTIDDERIRELKNVESKESIVFDENPNPSMMTSQHGIFVRLLQREGLLQVGSVDTNCDIFSVRLLIQSAKFLDNIVAEGSQISTKQDFFINYILLGNNHSRKLDRKFNRTHQIQEKISINFRSSLQSLQEYFVHIFYVPIEIHSDNKIIGTAEIRLDQIIQIFNLKEFVEKYPKGLEYDGVLDLKTPNSHDAQNKPILEYKVLILYHATRKLHQLEVKKAKVQEIDEKAGGDCIPEVPPNKAHSELHSNHEETCSESDQSSKVEIEVVGTSKQLPKQIEESQNVPQKVTFAQSEKTDIELLLKTQESGIISRIPRLFSYNLQLKSMKFNKKPQKGIWQISFYHEMADTPRVFVNRNISDSDIDGNTVLFKDLELKLYFTSNAEDIMDLVKSTNVCTLCIRGPNNTHSKAFLDCGSLLISNKEKTCGNILMSNQNETVTALAEIYVYLADAGMNFNAKKAYSEVPEYDEAKGAKDQNATRIIDAQKDLLFDESIAYKMIDELEDWKMQQQKNFLVELKRVEQNYLEKFKNDYQNMKASYEEEFIEKNNELNVLTKTLEDAHNTIKQKNLENSKTDEYVKEMKMEIEKSYVDKLQLVKERTKQLEEEFMRELRLKDIKIEDLECNNKQLQDKVNFLTHQNCDLKGDIECLNAKLESLKLNLVPKEEVENIIHEMRTLQEKCEAATQSKNFYKEQWAKSFRECHKIRREITHNRKDHIFNSKCDRLCDVLSDESSRLNFDKEELEEIKHCLSLDDDCNEL